VSYPLEADRIGEFALALTTAMPRYVAVDAPA
jgi:hypothetical protein